METRRNTTAGVLFWTPAPVRISRTSSVVSEDVWEDEDEEQEEKDDDFVSQMDENGIIGLSEALEDVELGKSCDLDADYNPNLYPGPLTTKEAESSGLERDTPGELGYNLSQHLSHAKSPGDHVQIPSPLEDVVDRLKARTADDEVKQRKEEQGTECVSEWDKYLVMTEEVKDGEEAGKRSDRKRKKNNHTSKPRKLGTTNDLTESYISKENIEKISSTQSSSVHLLATEHARVSSHHCPISQHASPVTAPTFPLLLHFTAEEIASAPGIDAETLPEISLTESPSLSHRSHIPVSVKSSHRCPEVKLRASPQPAAIFPEEVMSSHYSAVSDGPLKGSEKCDKPHKQPTPSPRKMRQPSPEATCSRSRSLSTVRADFSKFKHQNTSPDRESRTPRAKSDAAEVDESRKGPLSYPTPDFSKVEPRVRFPKSGYKPPKSRRSSNRESLSPEPPLVFKSPADILKEVLLNTTDGSPASSDSDKPPTSVLHIVPQEFRCPQQATILFEQLQESHSRLLTKYAEAQNTIDRMRLEAKVNLYSDPPKPGHVVQSGLNQDTSKPMMLNFPQAQRAEINSASPHPNGHSTHQGSSPARPSPRSPDPRVGQKLVKILYNQAGKFLQQLQTTEDLLKSKKIKPVQLMKDLSQLCEGCDSLERGYLLARDEHKLLQQQRAEISHFDPDRELEGLIFQCGQRMDELKEQVEQMQQEQPTCEAPPSPSPHPTPSSVPSEGGETLTHPQSPPVPLLVDPGEAAAVEVSSASEESEEEEERLNSLHLRPLNDKHRHVEQDFAALMDHYQSFKELPKLLDHNQKEGALRGYMQPGDKEKERQGRETGNVKVQKSLPQSKDKSDHQDSPHARTSKQQTSRSSPPSRRTSSPSTTLPLHRPSSRKRLEVGKSHSSSLSSLGEITALDRRNSKLQTGSSRVLSQDGIISPETDSGFVCSESSRLTPAAAPSPLHQRASESVSVPREGNQGNPQTGAVSEPSPASSPSQSRTAMEPRRGPRLSHDQPKRTRQGQRRRNFSCSPQHWVRQTEQTGADSGTSEFGLESDSSHTVSEGGQNDQYTLHSSSPSSSPAARYHHGDSLTALSLSHSANRDDAIQTLQAEVTRLRESIEGCLINKKPLSSVRAAPSARETSTHHNTFTPHIRPRERWTDVSRGGRDRQMVDEVEEAPLRRTTRKRSPSAHRQKPQPDILTGSEPSAPQPKPLVSRSTQTSTAAPDSCRSRTNKGHSRTHPRQHPRASVEVSETADEPDSRGRRAPLCPQCLSRRRGRFEMPAGGDREPSHSSCCHHCPLCGRSESCRSTEPDCGRVSDSPVHTSCQPAESLDRAAKTRYFAAPAPPALLKCMPVCPPPLLLFSSPLYVSPSNSTGTSPGVRGRGEVRGRTRRSLSADKRCSMDSSVDDSLNRAIRAARHMKHTSGHMVRSLAAGLHHQQLLTQS